MSNSVFHNWAHNITAGENSRLSVVQSYVRQSNVYFDPDTRTIYSYGSHFPMARFVTNKKGETAVVFTRRTYSSSTANHLSCARSAVSHLTVYELPNVSDRTSVYESGKGSREVSAFEAQDWRAAYEALIDDANKEEAKARCARTNGPWYHGEAMNALADAKALAQFAGLRVKVPTEPNDRTVRRIIAEKKAKRKETREREKARQASLKHAEEVEFNRFIAGESNYCPAVWQSDPRAVARYEAMKTQEKVEKRNDFEAFLRGETGNCPSVWRDDPEAQPRLAEIAETTRLARKNASQERFEAFLNSENPSGYEYGCPFDWRDDPRAIAKLAEMQAKAREKDRATFEVWINGEAVHLPPSYSHDENGSAYLRTYKGEVQTSQYASVPLEHAIRAYRFVKLCRMSGRTYQTNGHSVRVGHFTLDKITAEGNVNVGCHFFTWEQLNAWAVRQGIADAPASDEALTNSTTSR